MDVMSAIIVAPNPEPASLFDRLVGGQSQRNVFDAHVFACILAHRWSGGVHSFGLSHADLSAVLGRYFPAAAAEGLLPPDGALPLSRWQDQERRDIERLLLSYRAGSHIEEVWLTAIIARACQDDDILWQSLGLDGPRHLTAIFARHFPTLVALNPSGRLWKQAIFRLLCADMGLLPCSGDGPCTARCEAESACFASGW